jgi:hypothetical protein
MRLLMIVSMLLFGLSCSGGDKHLPSSNPPEYDPAKVYAPPVSPHASAPQGARAPDKPLAAGTVVPDPCEQQIKQPHKPGEPPGVCGRETGHDGGAIAGRESGRGPSSGVGRGSGNGRESADAVARRLSYVLEFHSRIVDREPTAQAESVAEGNVKLTFVEGKDMYHGSGLLNYQTGPPPNRDACSSLIMGHGTTRLDVTGLFITIIEATPSADITLHYVIHPTSETERPIAGQCAPGKAVPHPFFSAMYAMSRGAPKINVLEGWTYVGRNGVVAKKVLRGSCGNHCQDETVFTLKDADVQASAPK